MLDGKKRCSNCGTQKPMDKFTINPKTNIIYNTCEPCRARAEKKRERQRERAKTDIAYKKNRSNQWKKSRAKRREEMGDDVYKKKQSENAAKWRHNNPEKYREGQQKFYNTMERKIATYQSQSGCELTSKQILELIKSNCEYCGCVPPDDSGNGIDRLDSMILGYQLDNVVPACTVCNYMKSARDPMTFIQICEHISFMNGGIGKLYPECFENKTTYTSYDVYKKNCARIRNKDFELTKEEYLVYQEKDCYICGKKSMYDEHTNGIDRVDDNIGYVTWNCKSCCKTCNYMKGSRNLSEFIEKCKQVSVYSSGQKDKYKNIPRCINHTQKTGRMSKQKESCDFLETDETLMYANEFTEQQGKKICIAVTKTNKRCNRYALELSDFCKMHDTTIDKTIPDEVRCKSVNALGGRCQNKKEIDSVFCGRHKENPRIEKRKQVRSSEYEAAKKRRQRLARKQRLGIVKCHGTNHVGEPCKYSAIIHTNFCRFHTT